MNRRNFLLRTMACAGYAGLASAFSLPAQAQATQSLFDQVLPDMAGDDQALSQWQGRPLLVNFWATWCAPCVKEMPDLDALHRQFPDVTFVGLAVDTKVNVDKFLQKVQVAYPLLLIGNKGIALMRALGNKVGGLPFTVVLDTQGKVVETILGPVDPNALAVTLEGLHT